MKDHNITFWKSEYNRLEDISPLDYGYCLMWSNYWLDEYNSLNNEYLITLKERFTAAWVHKILRRLIEKKLIARVWRWQYVLNPNIAVDSKCGVYSNIYDLFN